MEHNDKTKDQLINELEQMRQRITELEKLGIEHKRIQEVLCESEEVLSSIVNRAPIVMFALDHEGIYIYSGGKGLDMLGLRPDELVGRSVYEVYADEPQILENIRRTFAGEEFTSITETAGLLWEVWHSPLRNQNGEVVGVIGIATDITERKQAQEALKASEEKYRDIFENVPVSIILCDEKGQMIDINLWHVASIGKGKTTKADYIGKNLITHPSIVNAGLSETYRKLHEKGEPFDIKEVYFPTTTGGVPCYFNVKGVPILKDGKVVGAITIHEDITERMQIQEEIERHYKVQDIVNSLLRISLEDISFQEQLERTLDAIVSTPLAPLMPNGAIFLVEDEPDVLVLKAEKGLPDALKAACKRVPFDKCLCGKAAKERKILFTDTIDHQHATQYEDIAPHGHYIVPIIAKEKTLGVIMLYVQQGHRPNREEEDFLEAISGTLAGIIERKKIQEAYNKAQERFTGIYNSSKDAMGYVNMDGFLLDVNDAFTRLTGYSKEELLSGKRYQDITPQEYSEFEAQKIAGLLKTGEPIEYEKEYIRKDGSRVPIHLTVFIAKGLDGKPIGLAGIIKDITEQKKAQEALEQSERFLSDIFNSIQDGISVLDKEMNIIMVSPAMEKWYAHAMPLVGKKCYEAYQCRNSPCRVCPTRQTLDTAKPAYEVVPKRATGGQIVGWVDLYTFPFFDTPSGQIKGVIEYVRDVTERRRMEMERERLNKELIKSNKKLKQLALRDPHTGLYNHHYLAEVIEAEFYRARRYGHSLSVIMLDIDYFKSINDAYGHNFGDLVLKQLAQLLKKMVRRYDVVVRFGGEEFVVMSGGTDRPTALVLAHRVLDAINLYNFGNKQNTIKLKLSVAVASYPEDRVLKGIDLIELADQLLNKVKEHGGNRVYSSQDIKKKKQVVEAQKGEETTEVKSLKDRIDKLTRRANQSLMEAVFAFAKTIKLKDHYSGEHVERTVYYAIEVAQALKLSEEEVERVRHAAILHDLGKVGISEKILLKKSKLTKKEFDEIKNHPRIGVDIIRPIQFLHSIIPLILYHHERWDGKGYPNGLKGEDIPVGARIIAIADVYQALTSNRPYRRAYPKAEAIKIIKNNSGSQFDPQIVNAFLKILQKEKNLKR